MAVTENEGERHGVEALRATLRGVIETKAWERAITAVILVNAAALGLETSPTFAGRLGPLLGIIDRVILWIFVVEIATRLFAYGARFWRDPWSLFDFTIVAVSLLPTTGSFSVLRALRVIRALRLISTVRSVRRVVAGLLAAIPGLGAVITLLTLIFYVFSVMATKLFGATNPDAFGTIGASSYTLFQVMTLEGWAEIAEPVNQHHPYAWLFFIIFILVTSFVILNLFIGIIVDSMQMEQEAEMRDNRLRSEANFDEVLAEIRALRTEIAALRGTQDIGDNRQAELNLRADSA